MLLTLLLKSIIRKGTLRLITADGENHAFGDGLPPNVTVKLHRKSLEWTLGLNADLKIGEAYMDGLLTIEEGSLGDFLYIMLSNDNRHSKNGSAFFRWLGWLNGRFAWLKQFNPPQRARRNVAYHYDLPDQIYDFFLDHDRQYSCGYFIHPHKTLEQAQFDKKRHIASKLLLDRPGLKVLDIGSGWGGLGLYLAREAGSDVTGITLSVNQYRISRSRARNAGLDETCRFALRDYRQEKGPYDRIVSVGMFEHVGRKNYDEFFSHIHKLLADDGVCLLHAIGRYGGPGQVNAFIRRHIFPGTDLAALPEVLEPIDRSGLFVTDIEILRLHYAETLKHWSSRFHSHRAEIISLYGERFYRKWEFYLIGCEQAFRCGHLMVFQIQLSKKLGAVPIVRDYMYEWEHAHDAARKVSSLSA